MEEDKDCLAVPMDPDTNSDNATNPKEKYNDEEPKDVGNVVYLTFLIWGIAVLMPWNSVSSCFDFMNIFVGENATPQPGSNVCSIYPFANNGVVIFGMMLVIVTGNKYSYNLRISGGCAIAAVFLLIIPFTIRIGG